MQIFALSKDQIVQIFDWVDNEEGFSLPVRMLQKFPKMRMRNDLIQNYCYLIKTSLLRNLLEDPKAQRFYKFKEELVPLLLKKTVRIEHKCECFYSAWRVLQQKGL